jgi:hypothetical protein
VRVARLAGGVLYGKVEIDPGVVAATEDPVPEPYAQDLAEAPAASLA